MKPTNDYRLVKKLLGRDPLISPKFVYLVDGQGIWTLHDHQDGLMIHADMPPGQRGEKARESAREAFEWVFDNTPAKAIYAEIPKSNRPACFMAAWAGMKFTHENEDLRCYRYG